VSEPVAVYLELGAKRVFAGALDWPGWCRSGRDEGRALEALAAAALRYAAVAARAGAPFPADASFEVRERLPGSMATDFGAPGAVPAFDATPLTSEQARAMAALVRASWAVLDDVVAGAPAELRKGPRGGGRDRDRVFEHVIAAESSYARKIGVRDPAPTPGDGAAVAILRAAIAEALDAASDGAPPRERGWPPRYAARRIAWHVLDHAWEIEDRSH
jgi:hypothetical protein